MENKQEVMIKLKGKAFRCQCGCNVFTQVGRLKDNDEIVYTCNACGERYAGKFKEE